MLSLLRTVAATALVLACAGLPARAGDWHTDAPESPIFATHPPAVPALLQLRANETQTPIAPTPAAVDTVFRTALQAGLAGLPPTPALASIWKSVGDFYRENDFRPFWRQGNAWSPAARSALSRVLRAREDALSQPGFVPAALADGSAENLAAQELAP